jgi:hypothetical protein
VPWSEFAAWLATPLETNDKHRQGFSPLTGIRPTEDGGRKGADLVAGFIAFEFDKSATPAIFDQVVARLTDFDAVIYSTANATPDEPRFRVVVRPSRPVRGRAEYRTCVERLAMIIGAQPAPESFQHSRLWYRAITGGKMPTVIRIHRGRALDVDEALRLFPIRPGRPPKQVDPLAMSKVPIEERSARCWRALQRLPDEGSFRAVAVCHDYAVPPDLALELVTRWGQLHGWVDFDGIEDRIDRVYEGGYASGEIGNALRPAIDPRPLCDLAFGRSLLENAIDQWLASDVRVCAVIAPMKLGKTYQAERLWAHARNALAVVPSRELVDDLVRRFPGAADYRETVGGADKLITTVHSADRFEPFSDLDLVIHDEVIMSERSIHSLIVRDARKTMRAFRASLMQPRKVMIMGADLSREDVARYERWTGEPIRVVDLSNITTMHREVIETHAEAARQAFKVACGQPGRVVLFSESKAELEKQALLVANDFPDRRAIVVHADTRGGARLRSGDWDVLLANQAMALGVDITAPVAQVVMIRSMRSVAPSIAMQTLGRIRELAEPTIIVGSPDWQPLARHTDPQVLWAESSEGYAHEPIDGVIADSWVAACAADDVAWNDPSLRDACIAAGWGWSEQRPKFKRSKAERDHDRAFKTLEQEEYEKRVLAAPSIESIEADSIIRKRDRTPLENAALARHHLESHFGPDREIDGIVANRPSGQPYVTRLRAFARACDQRLAATVQERDDDPRVPSSRRNPWGKAEARRRLWCMLTGVELAPAIIPSTTLEQLPWTTVDHAVAVVETLREEHGRRVPYLGNLPVPGEEVPWVRRQLAQFGIEWGGGKHDKRVILLAPTKGRIDHYAKHRGIVMPVRRRGRPARVSATLAASTVASEGGVRAAARALDVSPSRIHDALKK